MDIYIVVGEIKYEGYTILKSYKDRGDAEDFAKLCSDYEDIAPTNYQSTCYHSDCKKWRLSHPLTTDDDDEYGYNGGYDVIECELL